MAQDILITPGSGEPQILFRGSGTNDTPIELNVLSSYQSASSSGSALLFEGTEGQLFAITDNLSSGVIFSVAGAAGLPFIEADASGDVRLIEYGRYVGVGTGTPAYQLDVFGTGRFSEGILFADGNVQTGAYTGDGGGGGTPGGSNTQVQFNDGGSFGGDSNFTWDKSADKLTISVNHTDDALLLTSTETSSTASPVVTFKRDSASPANGDYLGQLKFKGESDTSAERVYAKITAKILDVTNGAEDGLIEYSVREGGSNKIMSRFRGDGIRVLNGANFIAETDSKVGVGNTNPTYQVDVVGTGNFTGGVRFPDGNIQTAAASAGGSDTNIQFNNGGSFSGESTFTWDYDTDALTVSGTTLMAGTGVILDVKTTGGTTLFAVEDTTETTLVVNSQNGQTSHPFEVRDAFGLTAASIDVSGNISGNHISFGDGTTQTTAATASGPPAVVSDTGTAITMVCNTHADKYLRTTANSAVTITFPSGLGCDANSEFTFEQAGSGQITVTGAAGVTINTSSTTKSYTQFSVISMKQVATDTYTLFGDTASF